MIEILNKILKEFTTEDDSTLDDYIFIQGLTNIINTTKLKDEKNIARYEYPLDKSIRLSKEFLGSINEEYRELLDYNLKHGIIKFHAKELEDTRLSTVNVSKTKKKINIYLENNIEDTFTITHELIHYYNMDLDNITLNWNLVTEGISLIFEELQRRYLMDKNVKDINYNIKEELYALSIKAYQLDFELNLIKLYMQYGFINNQMFESLFINKSKAYVEVAYQDLEYILMNNDLKFSLLCRDIIGGCMLGLFANNIERYKDRIIELNDNCNNMTFIDSLKLFDLSLDDEEIVILDKKSEERINRDYKTFVMSIFR